jgi:hypothetical protein
MKHQKVYVLRVNGSGEQYAGYMTDFSEHLYQELEIDREWAEQVALTDEFMAVFNKEGAVLGLPLNRALYDADRNLVTVAGGNMFIRKQISGVCCDVLLSDIALIESRIRAVHTISHGFVFTRERSELKDWKKKHD